jgi:hypothetical protein
MSTRVEGSRFRSPSLLSLILFAAGILLSFAPGARATPDLPVVAAPPDGASVAAPSVQLTAYVTDPEPGALQVKFYGRLAVSPPAPFRIAVLPDTQHYSMNDPATFNAQTQWIVNHQTSDNIIYVAHEGDLVNDYGDNSTEWSNANAAMSLLDTANIAYGMSLGNHDLPSAFNARFPFTRYAARSWYGGHYGADNSNHYTLFGSGAYQFVAIHLQWNMSADVITWAHGVLDSYPNRRGILVAHSLITCGAGWSADGARVYDGLKDCPNLFLMLCGHEAAGQGVWPAGKCEARRADTYNGRTVCTLLADYQNMCKTDGQCGCGGACDNGDGWMRIMEFVPAVNEIRVKTYSPTVGQYQTGADSEFTLTYDMIAPFVELGTVGGIPSGNDCSLVWTNREADHAYEWYVSVSDGQSTTMGPVWTFTAVQVTGACCLANGECQLKTESECGAAGGTFHGNGTTCSQLDSDSDGVNDCNDQCPGTPPGQAVNAAGCSCSQRDSDQDGVNDCSDLCPGTPSGQSVNGSGCSCSQLDTDGDGVNNCSDLCPNTPAGQSVNASGCSCSQLDADGDGVNDCNDQCPGTPAGQSVNASGCSCSQLDADGDGVNNCSDLCPNTPAGQSVNASGCSCSQLAGDCNDNNVCNGTETCDDGECVAGTPLNCNDGNACTSDTCDPASGCVHEALSCDDGNVCTDDSCNPVTGCVHTNNSASCDDGNLCTTNDTCANGACTGTPISCPGGQTCDPANGQCKAASQTVTFQNGLNGYAGTADTYLRQQASTTNYGSDPTLRWDTEESGAGTPMYTLIRFDGVFGTGSNQIPPGAQIISATLTYTIGGDTSPEGNAASLHELRAAFDEAQVTYANFGGDAGVQSDEYAATPIATVTAPSAAAYSISVLASLQAWSSNPAQNLGWIIIPSGSDGVRARSSEYSVAADRPKLTVRYSGGCIADNDGDGVNDCNDQCPGTPPGQAVNAAGCSCSQRDSDQDGVNDCSDLCPGTPSGQSVNGSGCSCAQLDSDMDGVSDCVDHCPGTPPGEPANAAGCGCSQMSCDDGDPCTVDSCVNGACVFTKIVCDDQDPCTIDECVNGQCVYWLVNNYQGDVPDCRVNNPTPVNPEQEHPNQNSTAEVSGPATCGVGGGSGGLAALAGIMGFQALRTRKKR